MLFLVFFSKRKKRNFHSSKRDQKLHSVIHSVSEFPSPINIGVIDKTHKSAYQNAKFKTKLLSASIPFCPTGLIILFHHKTVYHNRKYMYHTASVLVATLKYTDQTVTGN